MNAAVVILALVTIQRLAELVIARRNTRALLARGAHEVGASHYPLIVALHAAWLVTLWIFAPGRAIVWPLIALFALLQALRLWVLATLGGRWTTRIIVLPGAPLVTGGPFHFIRHPNYAVVVAEIAVLPLAFGLAWVAVVFSLLNAAVLTIRIRAEGRALRGTPTRITQGGHPGEPLSTDDLEERAEEALRQYQAAGAEGRHADARIWLGIARTNYRRLQDGEDKAN